MKMTSDHGAYRACIVGCLFFFAAGVLAQSNTTVIGPTNPNLKYGADALLAGDADEGVRLTLLGLVYARGARERQTAKSNLCAGYLMLREYDTALAYCNEVLGENDGHWRAYSNRALIYVKLGQFDDAERDLEKGEAISPSSRKLKAVRRMLLDATNPVSPTIVIDDRRDSAEGADED
jgi:tetratricopeptide (TPR) repeat protein